MRRKLIKKLKSIKESAFTLLNKITTMINQLPDPNAKIRHAPHFRQQFLMPAYAKKSPIDHTSAHNHARDRRPKGPRHSSTMIYNHPRG